MALIQLEQLLALVFSNSEIAAVPDDILVKRKNLTEISNINAFLDWCEASSIGQKKAGPDRQNDWELGWSGDGVFYSEDEYNNVPYYFRKNTHVRLGPKVFEDLSGFAELDLLRALQSVVLDKYIPPTADAFIEFGCGTGSNLQFIKSLYPDLSYFGADWANSACDKLIGNSIVDDGHAFRVDFFNPDTYAAPKVPYVAFTNAALEQTGSEFHGFMRYLISDEKCLIGIHIEPIRELLDVSTKLNTQSFKYAKSRNYLNGFVEFMIDQDVRVLEARDYGIGSMFISGYQVFVWQNPNVSG